MRVYWSIARSAAPVAGRGSLPIARAKAATCGQWRRRSSVSAEGAARSAVWMTSHSCWSVIRLTAE
ncbi:hypothetical protein ACFXEL_03305 [Streptomyces sp. NPDC059382]|uniref:hypothetical protein n=1 Tax=unclassified Streptomyces TaxID=2593676 RepID=UPI00331CDDF8